MIYKLVISKAIPKVQLKKRVIPEISTYCYFFTKARYYRYVTKVIAIVTIVILYTIKTFYF